ncbi:EAL domain-containing protein [Kluyvera intermedia]|uniref:cyclic-guanylate-specific phosphodiesterase n=1 Tax=Kluyvera intermedia TaxID=61648 RepID=A0ABX6DLC1_KLUIN|nr:EAL domain-containing protein [Kluyvera intermedia]QGH28237.1 EAL domain-containing protein [Kluyvera intermedia]QGH37219.1 EAL domain-containing protein [Kluyvera intermedia]
MYRKYAGKVERKNYVIVGLVFLGSTALALWLMFGLAQRQLNAQIAHQAIPIHNAIDNLLNETHRVARESEGWIGKACDRQQEGRLNALLVREMRMLAVSLLDGNRIYCSSLLGNKGARVNLYSFNSQGMKIDDSLVSVGIPALSLYRRFTRGGIVVSADLRYLWGIMGNTNKDERFILLVNNNVLTQNGILKGRKAQAMMADYPQRQGSALYTLAWRSPSRADIWQEIWASSLYLLIIIVMPLLLSVLAWALLTRRRSLYQHLTNAVHQDRIMPYYQPIVCAHSNRVIGAEILARWEHPEIGFVPPDIFIPVAEKTQTIGLMTENLLRRVIADCQRPDNVLPDGFIFNVNISHSHLSASDFGIFAREFAAHFQKFGQKLTFEFTENEQIEINGDILQKLEIIRESGIAISLDDFGTGFSNLSWITSLSPDSIKIDRMFVNQISPNASTPLISCVIDMARQMGIKTVAEGVEHDYQVAWLQEHDIDCFQGYFYSRPLTFGDFLDYFRQDVMTQHLRMPPLPRDISLQH